MPTPFKPTIRADKNGNVTVTTSDTKVTGIGLEVSPLGAVSSGSKAPIKVNGSVTFPLQPGNWVFAVTFQNVNAASAIKIEVLTPENPSMIPPGPLTGGEPQHNIGRLIFVVRV